MPSLFRGAFWSVCLWALAASPGWAEPPPSEPVRPGLAEPGVPEPEAPVAPPFEPGIRLGMAFQFYTIDYVGASAFAAAYPIGWNRILFLPSGHATPELSFHSRFAIDNFGVSAAGLGSGHLRSSSLDIGSPFYVDWAYATHEQQDTLYHFGLLNFNREIQIGSTIKNPFDAARVYPIALSRYGGVGTPPLTPDGRLDVAANRPGLWLMGTNVALEVLDPNSTFVNFPVPALSFIHERPVGAGRLTVATMDGTPGASPARARDPEVARTLYLPANYPATAPHRQGYSLALYDHPLDWGRLQLGFRADNNTLGTWQGKYSSMTLDVGDERFGGALTLAGDGLPLDNAGGYIWHREPNGIDLGFGFKASGWLQAAPTSYLSYGPIVTVPLPSWLPPLTVAAQQTTGLEGRMLAAGLTAETTFKLLPTLPEIHAEYSLGKFDPGASNALWNFQQPFTHQLYSVLTTFSF